MNNKETNQTKPVAGLKSTSFSSGSSTIDHATSAPTTTAPTLDHTRQRMTEERAAKEASRASMHHATGTGTTGIVASGIPGAVLERSQKRQKEAKRATTDGLVDSMDDRKPPPSATATRGLKRSVEEMAAKDAARRSSTGSGLLDSTDDRKPPPSATATRGLKRSVEEKAAKNAARRSSTGSATLSASAVVPSPAAQRGLKQSEEEKDAKKAARGNNAGATNQAQAISSRSAAMAMVNPMGSNGSAAAAAMQPGAHCVTASDTVSSTSDERSSRSTTMCGLAKNRKPAVSGQAPATVRGTSDERSSATTRNPSVSVQAPATVTENEPGNTQVVQSEMASVGINGEGLGTAIQTQNDCEPEAPAPIPNPLQPLEIEDNFVYAANMPSASPVDENQTWQHAVPVEQYNETEGSGRKSPLIFIIVGLFVVIGIIVTGVCGSGHCSSKDSSSEEQELGPRDMEGMEIKAQLEKVLGPTYFDGSTENTEPHQKALNWIIHQDPHQLPWNSNHLLQRFILTQFYYSTSQASPWKFCGAASGAQTDVCKERHLSHQFFSERWLSGVPECRWAGCSCEGETKNITVVDIWDNSFTGSLPSELGLLSHAVRLSFRSQDFTGTIPTEMYQLKALTNLDLSDNTFTGTIDPAVFSMPSLGTLHFWGNQMTGTIPTEIGLFQGEVLFMHINSFTGTIPSELFSANKVRFFYFGDNKLSGTIPTEVGLLSQQVHLDTNADFQPDSGPSFGFARNNALSGTIPSEFGLVDKLSEFNIGDTRVEGTIPEELILNCLNLWFLRVENCNLRGTLSTNLGLLTNLRFLLLANNNFSGSIPVELEALTLLEGFTTDGNPELRGSIPGGLCFENMFNAQGHEFVVDCATTTITASDGTTGMGEPLVSCPEGCCSACCDGGTGICMEQ